jgi:hypothetical protein
MFAEPLYFDLYLSLDQTGNGYPGKALLIFPCLVVHNSYMTTLFARYGQ